jgi:hypothetical protein
VHLIEAGQREERRVRKPASDGLVEHPRSVGGNGA